MVKTSRSPGLRRMMARAGSKSTFKEGRDDLKIYAGIEVSAKDVERVAERIGADMETWSEKQRQALIGQDVEVGADNAHLLRVVGQRSVREMAKLVPSAQGVGNTP